MAVSELHYFVPRLSEEFFSTKVHFADTFYDRLIVGLEIKGDLDIDTARKLLFGENEKVWELGNNNNFPVLQLAAKR